MHTATVFAQEMGVDYSTVMRWLKRQLVPGAMPRESPERGKWWEIPEIALQIRQPGLRLADNGKQPSYIAGQVQKKSALKLFH